MQIPPKIKTFIIKNPVLKYFIISKIVNNSPSFTAAAAEEVLQTSQ